MAAGTCRVGTQRAAVRAVPAGALTLAAEPGYELDDQGAQDGQAGADDGDVRLNNGPHDVVDVVRVVGARGEEVERREA